jgi:hypothetical protein
MYIIPKEQATPDAGYWGYAAATPKSGMTRAPAMLQSPDGTDWEVLAPAEMKWDDTPQRDMEYGGCERIGGKYYLIGGAGEYISNGYSMYTLVSDGPRGPFSPDVEAYRLCGTTGKTVTWLAAWARTDDELLISNYASYSSDKWRPTMLPLRKPVVDKDGHLRLGWWKGNEALKGKALVLKENTIELDTLDKKSNYQIVYLSEEFDLQKGIVLEGRIRTGPLRINVLPSAGFVFRQSPEQSMAVLLGIGQAMGRQSHIGRLRTTAEGKMQFDSEDITGKYCATVTGIENNKEHNFRLLVRRGMFELYIDNMLMQTYVYEPGSGKVGFAVHDAKVIFRNLQAWNMSL